MLSLPLPLLLLLLSPLFTLAAVGLQLPNTSGIDGDLTASLQVDKFFSLWLVFNNDEVHMSDEPFTIFAPRNNVGGALDNHETLKSRPDLIKKLLLDHIVLGVKLDLSLKTAFTFTALGGRTVRVHRLNGTQYANEATIVNPRVEVPGGILVVVDGYLFSDELYNASSPAALLALASEESPTQTPAIKVGEPGLDSNSTFLENVSQVLSFLKSGVRVFQHFLSRSNVSQHLRDNEEYTVLVPTDHAFQRWHPIDWGFYPFSVPEFTESIMVNHFLRGNLRQENIRDGQVATTLGGREVQFSKKEIPGAEKATLHTLTVNGASIVNGDTPVARGNIMFIGEVLFVTDSVVHRLHQQNRDKETPPLLAFPWFDSQFLSHAFMALEHQRRFTHITRFLNLAELAPYITGTGYTFFVPVDSAFESSSLDAMPDNYLSAGAGLQILLNHFVKGRLYDRDLQDGKEFHTIGNRTIIIHRTAEGVKVNDAKIIESEVFVYNLGTMYFIDKILFADINGKLETTTAGSTSPPTTVTPPHPDVETVPEELNPDLTQGQDSLVSESGMSTVKSRNTTTTNP